MNFNEYQNNVQKLAITKLTGINEVMYSTLGILGEAGEISEKIKKIVRDKNGIISEEDKELLGKETGDVLFYIAKFLSDIGLDFETIAMENIKKCRDRELRGVISGSGDNR